MVKVIIADDEEKVCQLICSLIDWESLDMKVIGVAHNGIEALELVKSLKPDLMITDIRMPGCDGLELISRVKQLQGDMDFIIISGYSYFEYAQSAIKFGVVDYLLKPIKKNELMNTLAKMSDKYRMRVEQLSKEEHLKIRLQSDMDKLRSALFTEVLLQKSSNGEELTIDRINENYYFKFKEGCFQVAIVKIDCGFGKDNDNSIRLFEDKIVQALKDNLKKRCYDMETHIDDSMTYCVMNFERSGRKVMRKQLKAVLDELLIQKNIFGQLELTIGLGSAVEDVKLLRDSCSGAQLSAAERLIIGRGNLIEGVEAVDTHHIASRILAELNKTMGSALEVLDKEGVLASLNSLDANIKCEQRINGDGAFTLLKEACSMYITLLRNNQLILNNPDVFYEDFCLYASRCRSVDEILKYLSIVIGQSLDQIIENKKQADTKPIRMAKQYIQENYMKPITLDEVSSYVGFSASYFSTLFKKESGSNFLEYLSEVRMNRAKELLKESRLSIGDICEQVGYMDIKHFTKSFKKIAGIKPNEYRKLYS